MSEKNFNSRHKIVELERKMNLHLLYDETFSCNEIDLSGKE